MEDGGIVQRADANEVDRGTIEFAALAARLTAALDAIESAAATAAPAEGDAAALEARIAVLEDELETERSVNAQLDDRIAQIRSRHEATLARVEAERVEARAMLAELEGEMRQLRAVNDRLRDTSQGLREACAAGPVDGAAVNEAMRAELEALRNAQASSRREIDSLIGELAPLVEQESA